eukprot:gene15604-18499_t
MGLKAMGAYLARTLSYKGAEFEVYNTTLDPEFKSALPMHFAFKFLKQMMYNRSCDFWRLLLKVFDAAGEMSGRRKKVKMAQFWGTHQRFYRMMLMASKVPGRCALSPLTTLTFDS